MKTLFDNYKLPEKKEEKVNIHTQYQDEGVRCCDALGIKDGRKRGRIINMFKKNPSRAGAAFSYLADAKNVNNPFALFLWKYKQLGQKK